MIVHAFKTHMKMINPVYCVILNVKLAKYLLTIVIHVQVVIPETYRIIVPANPDISKTTKYLVKFVNILVKLVLILTTV